MRQRRECPRGHVYFKSSTCPVCPRCEANGKPGAEFFAGLAAPARRALEGAGITTIRRLAACTEGEVAKLHGMGPNAMARLRLALKKADLSFSRIESVLLHPARTAR